MAKLEISVLEEFNAPDGRTVRMVQADGSIDASTALEFREVMEQHLADGMKVVALDCGSLKYINSTGMGILLTLADIYEEQSARLVVCRVPPKIKALLTMLGVDSRYTLHATREGALREAGALAAPAPPAPAPQPADESNTGKSTTTRLPSFPVRVSCVNCGTRLRIRAAGKYRCPRCGIHYSVSEEARVKAYNTVRPKVAELRVPVDPELCESIRNAARSIARGSRFSEEALDQIETGVDELTNLIVQRAKDQPEIRFLNIFLVGDEVEFIAGFRLPTILVGVSGRDVQWTDEEQTTVQMIQAIGGRVEAMPSEPQGQVIVWTKPVEAAAPGSRAV